MTTHPAILVDERRRSIDHPRRIPLSLGRPLLFASDGFTTLPTSGSAPGSAGASRGVLTASPQHVLLHAGRKPAQRLSIGDRFRVARHPWRLERGDELIVDPRRMDEYVAFNCFHAVDDDVRWRAFDINDPDRELFDLESGNPAPSSAGMALELIVSLTELQGARIDATLAAALVEPLVHAAYEDMSVRAPGVTVTWDGDTRIDDVGEPEPQEHGIARAVTTFSRLVGRELLIEVFGQADLHALAAVERAPRQDVARLVRGLFPEAWAVEAAVREQAAMLDPSMLA